MSKPEIEHALLVSRLSLERCNMYLAHLSAILHLLDDSTLESDTLPLISGLEKELAQSAKSLSGIC